MAEYVDEGLKRIGITISKPMLAVVCFISGLMVILLPSLLVWIVGLFLVIQGALLLTEYYEQEKQTTATVAFAGVYCQNCGAGNTNEAVHCKKCGKELSQTEQIFTAQEQETTQ